MSGYKPTFIGGPEVGLVQNRQNFLLSNDGFPQLLNAYVWREQIKRKQGYVTLGRLSRIFDDYAAGTTDGSNPYVFNLYTAINLSGTVIGATKTNPIQITTGAAHGLFSGQYVSFDSLGGMTQLNGDAYQITVTGANTFTIPLNGTLAYYTAYTVGGTWETGNTGTALTEPDKTIMCGSVEINVNPSTLTGTIIGYTSTRQKDTSFTTAAPHGLTIGNIVNISGIVTVPGSGPNRINGGPYTVTATNSATTFRIAVNCKKYGDYQSGGMFTRLSGTTFTDNGNGTLSPSGSVNYLTGAVSLPGVAGGLPLVVTFTYFPGLPVMGILDEETNYVNSDQTIFFDTRYAYQWNNGFEELLPGTVWTGTDFQFFWGTNYWVDSGNNKIFWETTFNSDPIRYTNGNEGTNWVDFSPIVNQANDRLNTCRCMLPFRGRMVTFNTVENNIAYPNRIRWAQIGNPFTEASAIVSTVSADAWRDDIRGKGGFLDIPTSQDIVTVGFVRDNLVIYCERSTWQLRYTGRSIAPFQIEKVNTELGVESTFSGIQFDTSIVGIGDKGIVECDSYKSNRIDVKIPDLVMTQISNEDQGVQRVYGVRDFQKKLAYWIYPSVIDIVGDFEFDGIYPNRRLCYNYENDSWSIFTDSLTAMGTFQNVNSKTWNDYPGTIWAEANFPWDSLQSEFPVVTAGNQQGYILYLNQQVSNDRSLFITNIVGHADTLEPTVITSPNHNLEDSMVIKIINVAEGTDPGTNNYNSLNNGVFGVVVTDEDTFLIYEYDTNTREFSAPNQQTPGTYIGCGEIEVRDNFSIVSKRFNYNDQGKQYQLGHVDLLVETTQEGAFTINVFNDYQSYITGDASNRAPQNSDEDTFFNSIVETYVLPETIDGGEKQWRRVFCPTQSNFVTLEYTLSNLQMTDVEQESDVVIDAQTIWSRPGGRVGFLT